MTTKKPTNPSHGELLDDFARLLIKARFDALTAGELDKLDRLRSLILGKMGEGEKARNIQDNADVRGIEIRLNWAESADVLYLSFGDTPAHQRFDDSSGDVIRYNRETGQPSGATIICFAKRAAKEEIKLKWETAHLAPQAGVPQNDPCVTDLKRRPRMGSAVIIRDDQGRVLVGQRCKDPFRGYWVIPGGGIWPNETINDAAIREIKEETGLDIEITGRLGVFEDINETFHIILVMSFGRVLAGELKSGDDCGELRWIGQQEFAELQTTPINKQVFALLAAPPASHTPRCPSGHTGLVLRKVAPGDVAVQCPACMPDGTWYIHDLSDMAQFFPVTSSQGGAMDALLDKAVLNQGRPPDIERLAEDSCKAGEAEYGPSPAPEVMGTPKDHLEAWKKVCQSKLFQFLKHEPIGRKIFGHLRNGDITFGKAAQSIVEAFELGIEPALPEWHGDKTDDTQPDPWVDVKVGLPKYAPEVIGDPAIMGTCSHASGAHPKYACCQGWRELPSPPEPRATEGK